MRFSVVIPVYNKSETLSFAIDSVLSQSFTDYEIVVVDDGSKDAFDDCITKYTQLPNIKIIKQQNSGVSVARNTGINNASGEFICFLDADDLWLSNHLEILDSLINKYSQNQYFATSHFTTYPNGNEINSSKVLIDYPEDFLCTNLFKLLNTINDGIIHTNSMCISKKLIIEHNIFFEPNERIGEDTDMWFRTALVSPIVISKIATTKYRREYSTATATTSNSMSWIFAKRVENCLEKEFDAQTIFECYKLVDRYYMTCSRDYLKSSQKKAAKEILKKVKFRNFKYLISRILCSIPLKVSTYLIKVHLEKAN